MFALVAALSMPVAAADAKLVFDWQTTAREVLKPTQSMRRVRAGVLANLAAFTALNPIEPRTHFEIERSATLAAQP